MWTLLLALSFAADPEPEPVELIPGVRDAGLPPPATNQLKPAGTPAPVAAVPQAVEIREVGLPPMLAPTPVAEVPPLKTHSSLPPPPPPIQAAGLPPMAEPIPLVQDVQRAAKPGEKLPPTPKVILWEDLPVAEDPEAVEAQAVEVRKVPE